MKPIHSLALLGALSTIAAHGAYTTPVGYYEFDGQAGGNIIAPAFVNTAAYSGVLTAAGSVTMTVAGGLTPGAFDAGVSFATHYVEITSGPNAGVSVDISSNTATVIALADNISALSLVGDESITIRPHVTVAGFFSSAEASLGAFSENITFYGAGGSQITYYYIAPGQWSSDFVNNDGGARPIPPCTGGVLTLDSAKTLPVVGEVKSTPSVVQILGGAVNIVGASNPLVGSSVRLDDLGFENLLAFTDPVTVYVQGGGLSSFNTYYADGAGNVTEDFVNPSSAVLDNTKGSVVSAGADTTVTIDPNLP